MNEKELEQQDAGEGTGGEEKLVPVGEAIRYRKRAQAAEKELLELKEVHDKQAEELSRLKEEAQAAAAPEPVVNASIKTQGVKETRTGGARSMLATAAGRAAESGSRADLQEYLRARRQYV